MPLLFRIRCDLKAKSTMYKKDFLKQWWSGHLASYGLYLDYPANSTPKLERGLKEKFEDTHLDKPTSPDFSFRGGKRSQSAKKLKKITDQFVGLSGDKCDEEDFE